MRKAENFVLALFSLFVFVGCAPSEQAIQEAIFETQMAMPTNTNTAEPTTTNTPEPSPTPTSTPTEVPTLTPTPDLRVITIDSKEFLLTKKDLPPEANYYLPNAAWISPHHNYEVISGWGVEEGQIYLERTGRIDGWWVYYDRGTRTVRVPEQIFHNIIQYKTAEGASLSMTTYGTRVNDPDYTVVDNPVELGDVTVIYLQKVMQSSGEYRVSYIVETSFRNYVSIVAGWGWEKEFDLDDVISIAEIALNKVKAAPLGIW